MPPVPHPTSLPAFPSALSVPSWVCYRHHFWVSAQMLWCFLLPSNTGDIIQIAHDIYLASAYTVFYLLPLNWAFFILQLWATILFLQIQIKNIDLNHLPCLYFHPTHTLKIFLHPLQYSARHYLSLSFRLHLAFVLITWNRFRLFPHISNFLAANSSSPPVSLPRYLICSYCLVLFTFPKSSRAVTSSLGIFCIRGVPYTIFYTPNTSINFLLTYLPHQPSHLHLTNPRPLPPTSTRLHPLALTSLTFDFH